MNSEAWLHVRVEGRGVALNLRFTPQLCQQSVGHSVMMMLLNSGLIKRHQGQISHVVVEVKDKDMCLRGGSLFDSCKEMPETLCTAHFRTQCCIFLSSSQGFPSHASWNKY